MNKYDELRKIEARLMGFAMSVKDLQESGNPMDPKLIAWTLICYVDEYNTIKDSINDSSK